MPLCTIDIHLRGAWRPIVHFEAEAAKLTGGYARCGGYLEYDPDYVTDFLTHGAEQFFPPVSLAVTPIDFLGLRHTRWPAFLLDLMPTGAGRRGWLDKLVLADDAVADWTLLLQGARHPVGWLRVVPGDGLPEEAPPEPAVGFGRDVVAAREQDFLEYMIEQGAQVNGSSDVQGESPKLLLTEDEAGLLHADGALPDERARRHWLVKFARRRTDLDRQILRNEGPLLRLADAFGADVHAVAAIEVVDGRALFVPRFDRVCSAGAVVRLGMESFAAAAGIAEFGKRRPHEEMCALIARYSSAPADDILEYLRRDVLNVCFGNTDNHLRNHAFLKQPDGTVRLSPLYDFAPMFLSDEGYARVLRWGEGLERMGQPDWAAVGSRLAAQADGPGALRLAALFDQLAEALGAVDDHAGAAGVEAALIERCRRTIDENRRLLKAGADRIAGL